MNLSWEETLDRLLDECLAAPVGPNARSWISTIIGAQGGDPECTRQVRELLAQQDDTHWSKLEQPL